MMSHLRPRVALVHPCMGRGGSEVTAMWLLQALGAEYDLTLITGCRADIVALDPAAGPRLARCPRPC
jgi:hypothetical protein